MAQVTSPGIVTREIVQIDTQIATGLTVPVIVGAASKGPVNVPTRVATESELVRTFGRPLASDYGLLSAIEYLRQGAALYYLRVADSAVATAASNILGPEGIAANGSIALSANPVDGDYVTIQDGALTRLFEFDIATAAAGTLTFSSTGPVDGDTLVLNDGINAAVTFEFDTAARATGTLVLGGQPADGDQFLINDGSVAVTFEFDNNTSVVESPTLRRVVIGATLGDTLTNLQNAINNTGFTFAITAGTPTGGDTVPLTHDNYGVVGNQAITEPVNVSTNLSDTGMASGDDITVSGANIGVVLGGTAEASLDNLVAAINAIGSTLRIAATKASATLVNLLNEVVGTAGNQAITDNLTNVAVVGMTGGANAGVTGGRIAVAVGSTAAITANNLKNAINAVSGFTIVATVSGATVLLRNTVLKGATGNIAITDTEAGSVITVLGMANGVNAGSTIGLSIAAATPGSWGNALQVIVSPTTVAGAPLGRFDLAVYATIGTDNTLQLVERFTNLSADSANARFAETVVNSGIVNESAASRYIVVDVLVNQAPIAGTYTLGVVTAGADGASALVAADYIGSISGASATGLQALRNSETLAFNVLAVPGVTLSTVIAEALAIVTARGDAIYVVDPPFGLNAQEAVDWHNGVSTLVANAPTSPLNSSFGDLYWPWIRTTNPYLQQSIWLPPSGFVLAAYAFTDKQVGPWVAPAGFQRGLVAGIGIEQSPDKATRELLLLNGNAINPIIADASSGSYVIFGNRTLLRTPGPLDAVHVRRMLIYLKATAVAATRNISFERNDPTTWRNVELLIQPIIDFLVSNRGVKPINADNTRPRVKCDADTNPAELQAQKTINAKIFVTHIDAGETLTLDFTLLASGVGTLSVA